MNHDSTEVRPGWRPVLDSSVGALLLCMLLLVSCVDRSRDASLLRTQATPEERARAIAMSLQTSGSARDVAAGDAPKITANQSASTGAEASLPSQPPVAVVAVPSSPPVADATPSVDEESQALAQLIASGQLQEARHRLASLGQGTRAFLRTAPGVELLNQLHRAEEAKAQELLTAVQGRSEELSSEQMREQLLTVSNAFPTTTAGRQAQQRQQILLRAELESEAKDALGPVAQHLIDKEPEEARVALAELLSRERRFANTLAIREVQNRLSLVEEQLAQEQLKRAIDRKDPGVLQALESVAEKYPKTNAAQLARQRQSEIRARLLEDEAINALKPIDQLISRGKLNEAAQALTQLLADQPKLQSTQASQGQHTKLQNAQEQQAQELLKSAKSLQTNGDLPAALRQIDQVTQQFPRSKAATAARQREREIRGQLREQEAVERFKSVESLANRGDFQEAASALTEAVSKQPELRATQAFQQAQSTVANAKERRAQEQLKSAIQMQTNGKSGDTILKLQQLITDFPETRAATDARKREQQLVADLREKKAVIRLRPIEQLVHRGDVEQAQKSLSDLLTAEPELRSTQALRGLELEVKKAQEKLAGEDLKLAQKEQAAGRTAEALKRFQELAQRYPQTQAAGDAQRQMQAIQLALRENEAKEKLGEVRGLLDRNEVSKARQTLSEVAAANRKLASSPAFQNLQRDLLAAETRLAKEQSVKAEIERDVQAQEAVRAAEKLINQGRLTDAQESLNTMLRARPELGASSVLRDVQKQLAAALAKESQARRNQEELAAKQLAEATKAYDGGMKEKARQLLDDIVKKYPATPAAIEAKNCLAALFGLSERKQ